MDLAYVNHEHHYWSPAEWIVWHSRRDPPIPTHPDELHAPTSAGGHASSWEDPAGPSNTSTTQAPYLIRHEEEHAEVERADFVPRSREQIARHRGSAAVSGIHSGTGAQEARATAERVRLTPRSPGQAAQQYLGLTIGGSRAADPDPSGHGPSLFLDRTSAYERAPRGLLPAAPSHVGEPDPYMEDSNMEVDD
eukprot:11313017-Heterocapsa_arctica.AAC.1